MTRRPSNSASTQTMISPFAQAARKFGGRMKWRATGVAPGSSRETKREASLDGASLAGIVCGDGGWGEISEPDGERMRADLPPLARFAAGANVLDVARAANAQSGAISFLPLAHFARKQRWLVGRSETPPVLTSSRAAFIACQPPAPDKSFSVI